MSCAEWEERIALAVSGDLPERKAAGVEAHLRACPACERLAEELRADRRIVNGLRAEALEGAALDEVRRRVLAGISRPAPARRWGPAWAYAAAACVFLAAGTAVLWRVQGPEPLAVPEIARLPEPPRIEAAPVPPPVARAPVRRRPVPKVRPRQAIAEPVKASPARAGVREPERQLVVKLLTDDPDVVIYLLVNENGG